MPFQRCRVGFRAEAGKKGHIPSFPTSQQHFLSPCVVQESLCWAVGGVAINRNRVKSPDQEKQPKRCCMMSTGRAQACKCLLIPESPRRVCLLGAVVIRALVLGSLSRAAEAVQEHIWRKHSGELHEENISVCAALVQPLGDLLGDPWREQTSELNPKCQKTALWLSQGLN